MAITQQTQTDDIQTTADSPTTDRLTVDGDKRRYVTTEAGVQIWSASVVGGAKACRATLIEWGEHEKVDQCPKCEKFHSVHSPPVCFGCATGMS